MTAAAQTKDSFSPPLCLLGDHLMSSSFGRDCEELVPFTYSLPLRKLQKSAPSTLLSLSAQVFLVCLVLVVVGVFSSLYGSCPMLLFLSPFYQCFQVLC